MTITYIPTRQSVCETCCGRGVVGGFVSADSGYQDDPCPDCSRPAQSVPDGWKQIGETREGGVVWFDKNPHAYPAGTTFYAAAPKPEGN